MKASSNSARPDSLLRVGLDGLVCTVTRPDFSFPIVAVIQVEVGCTDLCPVPVPMRSGPRGAIGFFFLAPPTGFTANALPFSSSGDIGSSPFLPSAMKRFTSFFLHDPIVFTTLYKVSSGLYPPLLSATVFTPSSCSRLGYLADVWTFSLPLMTRREVGRRLLFFLSSFQCKLGRTRLSLPLFEIRRFFRAPIMCELLSRYFLI